MNSVQSIQCNVRDRRCALALLMVVAIWRKPDNLSQTKSSHPFCGDDCVRRIDILVHRCLRDRLERKRIVGLRVRAT